MKRNTGVLLAICLFFFMLASANAKNFEFSDNVIFWPTWGNGTWTDFTDRINTPEISAVTVYTGTSQILTSIQVKMDRDPKELGGSGLFIDVDGDRTWEFFADNWNDKLVGGNWGERLHKLTEDVSLYKGGLNAGSYVMSAWSVFYREQHPVGISSNLWGTSYKFEYFYDDLSDILTYTFPIAAGITLSDDGNWMIGYTVQCANDVFLSPLPKPVPEPATMVLLVSGLAGLAAFRTKLRKKQE